MISKFHHISFIFLLSIASVSFYSCSGDEKNPESQDFAITDTSVVTKIVLKDAQSKVELEKINNLWNVNSSFAASSEQISNFLKVVSSLSVKAYVPAGERKKISQMLQNSILVEIYSNDELVKSYYTGKSSEDKKVLYMQLAGTDAPVLVEYFAPVDKKYPLFNTQPNAWKTKKIFCYNIKEIKNIIVNDNENPEKSFRISIDGNRYFLYSLYENNQVEEYSKDALRNYVSYFSNICYTEIVQNFTPQQRDSLIMLTPTFTIVVNDVNGNKSVLKTYKKIYGYSIENKPVYDLDKLYAIINENEIVVAKYFELDLILKEIDFFIDN